MFDQLNRAITEVEAANKVLDPDVVAAEDARRLMDLYARIEKLASYGVAALARRVDDYERC